ncbi:hypothetical protein EMCRGX_G016535 [Ephydatia muelleri]
MCVVRDGVLYVQKKKKNDHVLELRFVRTREEQLKILAACHHDPTAGHMGLKRTIKRITERYKWNGIVKDVQEMIRSCDACQRVNRKMVISTPQLHPLPVKAPWYHIGIDFIGPVNPTSSQGNRYILTISDYFSKLLKLYLCLIFMRMGIPKVLTSDNGSEFRNDLEMRLAKALGVKGYTLHLTIHRLTQVGNEECVVERINGAHLKPYQVADESSEVRNKVEKGKVCNKDLDKQQSEEIAVDKLDHDILWEQLFSSNLMRLWRTGACELLYDSKEDDEAFLTMKVKLLSSIGQYVKIGKKASVHMLGMKFVRGNISHVPESVRLALSTSLLSQEEF